MGFLLRIFCGRNPAQRPCKGNDSGTNNQPDDSRTNASGVNQPVEKMKEGMGIAAGNEEMALVGI